MSLFKNVATHSQNLKIFILFTYKWCIQETSNVLRKIEVQVKLKKLLRLKSERKSIVKIVLNVFIDCTIIHAYYLFCCSSWAFSIAQKNHLKTPRSKIVSWFAVWYRLKHFRELRPCSKNPQRFISTFCKLSYQRCWICSQVLYAYKLLREWLCLNLPQFSSATRKLSHNLNLCIDYRLRDLQNKATTKSVFGQIFHGSSSRKIKNGKLIH